MRRSINGVTLLCGLLALTAAAGGCQRESKWKLTPVEGTIIKDGQPLPGIQVVFLADDEGGTQGPRASDYTDAAGHYRLRSDNGEEGVVAGKHRVLLLDPKDAHKRPIRIAADGAEPPKDAKALNEQLVKERREAAKTASRVPSNYGRFDKTPLRVEVQTGSASSSGPQVFDFPVP